MVLAFAAGAGLGAAVTRSAGFRAVAVPMVAIAVLAGLEPAPAPAGASPGEQEAGQAASTDEAVPQVRR